MHYTHALNTFTATLKLQNQPSPLKITINKGDNINDAVAHFIKTNSTQPYLATPILSTVLAAMNQQAKLDFELTTKADNPTKNLRNGFIEDYQANTLQYHTKPEEDIFPRAYHTLVHCPISAIFNTLLELEQNYGLSIQAHFTAFEQELVALQAIHSRDIDPSFSPSNMTHHINHNHNQQQQHNHLSSLFARHTEEMEVLQATWASDLLQTQQTQRQEYRDFVIELYREYQLRLASLTDENNLKPEDTLAMAEKKLDGKEIIAAAAGRIPQWANNSKNKDIPNSSASSQLTGKSTIGSTNTTTNTTNTNNNTTPAAILTPASATTTTTTGTGTGTGPGPGTGTGTGTGTGNIASPAPAPAVANTTATSHLVSQYTAEPLLLHQQSVQSPAIIDTIEYNRRRQSSSASIGSSSHHYSNMPGSPSVIDQYQYQNQNQYQQQQQVSMLRTASLSQAESKEKALFQKMVSDIQEMGFPKEMAETALSLCHQNMEQAIAMLLENPQKVTAAAAAAAAAIQANPLQPTPQLAHRSQSQSVSGPQFRRSASLSYPSPLLPHQQLQLQLQLQQQQQHLQLQQQQQQQNLPFLPQTPLQRPMLSNASSPAHSRNSSWNEMPSTPTTAAGANNGSGLASNRRHSTQKIATAPAFLHLSGNKNNTNNSSNANTSTTTSSNKAWNPISFLQQQKQAMENTNLSSVRKLGGWLGKAMENLGIENDESDPRFSQESSASGFHNSQQLVESFTITLGTAQIKSTHNLRLLVADLASDILNPLPYDGPREMAYRAQTATNLYSTHLNAMIVLVELSELKQASLDDNIGWRNYKTGKGSNKALFERCQHSTEFHFPNIESQLSTIEADFNKYPDHLQEGCFFITRHSNLPLTQTVFHLVIDSDAIPSTDLSSRHNLITGLRNILRLVTRFDISSLSIPLLLLPDRYLEQPEYFFEQFEHHHNQAHQPPNWLHKRGEVTMKCVKGFLIENSRSGKRVQTDENVFGGGMRNVEFLLPSQAAIYGTGINGNGNGNGNGSGNGNGNGNGNSIGAAGTGGGGGAAAAGGSGNGNSGVGGITGNTGSIVAGGGNGGNNGTGNNGSVNGGSTGAGNGINNNGGANSNSNNNISNNNNGGGSYSTNPTSPVTATTPTTANAPVTSLGAFRHPQEVEFAFQQSRTLLVNLFRTS